MAKEYTLKLDQPHEGRILAPLGATMARFSLDDAAPDVEEREYRDLQEMLDKANSQPALLAALEDALGFVVAAKIAGQSGKMANSIPAPFALETKIRATLAAAKGA